MGLTPLFAFIHSLTAILGIGQIAAMASLVATAQKGSSGLVPVWAPLRRLARFGSYSLVVMLLSGVALDYAGGGAFHRMKWFQLSFLLLLVAGFLLGRAQGALKREPDDATIRRVKQGAWGTTLVVAVITALMVLKPW